MSRVTDNTRQERLERILRLLRQEGALKEIEISSHLNIERRSINNYLNELEYEGKVEKDGVCWQISSFKPIIPRNLSLDAEQIVILYLAIRLFVKQSDRRVETAETLLLKLADVVTEDLGGGAYFSRAVRELSSRPEDETHHDILRTLARGMLHQRQIEIIYQPYHGRDFKTVISPYLLEPSGIGFATYVIGHSSIVDTLRTYKVERIVSAQLLRTPFTIPENFPGLELLKNAWSIYYGEETIKVVLRFHPDVVRRVR